MAAQQQMVRGEVLMQLFGFDSIESIYRLTKSGIIKSEHVQGETARMYPFIESIQSYIRHLKDSDAKKNQINDALKEADLAKRELQTRELESKLALAEGNAHSTADIRRVWSDVIGSFKMRLWSLPHVASERLVGIESRDEVSDILSDEVRALCELLINWDEAAFFIRNPDYETEDDMSESEDEASDAQAAM